MTTPSAFLSNCPALKRGIESNRLFTQRSCSRSPRTWSLSLNTKASSRNETLTFDAQTSSLRAGILAVAVGKLGEKDVPPSLFSGLSYELDLAETMDVPSYLLFQRASFLGALFMKTRLTSSEYDLLAEWVMLPRTQSSATGRSRLPDVGSSTYNGAQVTAGHVVATVADRCDSNDELYEFALRLLSDDRLSREDAYRLGQLLYDDKAPTPIKALIAHAMRVRHETSDELAGLAKAVADSTRAYIGSLLKPSFHGTASTRTQLSPMVIIAEPFDGVLTWDLLTPLVARHIQNTLGLRAVMLAGKSSGPKMGPNLRDLGEALALPFYGPSNDDHIDAGTDKGNTFAPLGIIADQADINKGLARWVEMRRVIAKRPALATVEKYTDICADGSTLFVSSAFHPSYVEKMGIAAEAVGFSAYIIIGKGMEGTIGLGISDRPCKLLVGWRLAPEDNDTAHSGSEREAARETYARHWVEYHGKANLSPAMRQELERQQDRKMPQKGEANCQLMAEKIRRFLDEGSSGDVIFDARVAISTGAIDVARSLINREAPAIFSYKI